MKSLRSGVFLLPTLLVASLMSVAQVEKLAIAGVVQATVARHHGLTEDISAKQPDIVRIVASHADGKVFADVITHNLRTCGGIDWLANSMSATSARPAAANYIALTNDATAPAMPPAMSTCATGFTGDCAPSSQACTLTSEIGNNGLARTIATYAHSNGSFNYTLTNTFTAAGTQSVQKAAVFNAASSGTMVFEALFTQLNLVADDTVTITWTIQYF